MKYKNGPSECGETVILNQKAMAFLFLRDKYLGRVQGKHNVLKFFDFFCVNEKNNIERFAYYSRFKSSSIRRNNIIYHKYAILTKFGSSHSKTAGSEEYRKEIGDN